MTASACRSTPSGWSAVGFSGRRRLTGSSRSARRSWPICSMGSTGETRFAPGARGPPAERPTQSNRGVANCLTLWLRTLRVPGCEIIGPVVTTPEDLPNDIAALQAALLAERAKRIEGEARTARVEAELAVAKAKASDDQALIAHQQL